MVPVRGRVVFRYIYCFFSKPNTAHQRKTFAIVYYVYSSHFVLLSEARVVKFLLCSEEGRSSEGRLKSIAAKQLAKQIHVVKSELWLQEASTCGIFEGMTLHQSDSAIAGFP